LTGLLEAGHTPTPQAEGLSALGPRRDTEIHVAFQGRDPDLASQNGGEEVHGNLGVQAGVRGHVDHQVQIGQGAVFQGDDPAQAHAGAGAGTGGNLDLQATAVDFNVPGRAVIGLVEADGNGMLESRPTAAGAPGTGLGLNKRFPKAP